MSGNTFGRLFRLTTYGESHGPGLGGIIDGCPAGLELSEADLQKQLDLRRPGKGGHGGSASTARNEADRIRLLSGVFEGRTTGAPIAFHVENADNKSSDYTALKDIFRPGHADLSFHCKYGHRDHRGGGRSSGRETLSRVAGGAVALKYLESLGIRIYAGTAALGGIPALSEEFTGAEDRAFFALDENAVPLWEKRIEEVRAKGDTVGGIVRIAADGLPPGLGEPVFDKLDARLAYALMGVGAVKGVEVGAGFAAAGMTGSEHNDALLPAETGPRLPSGAAYGFASNNAGGTLGGMSSGARLVVSCAVKPIPSIASEQNTITVRGEAETIRVGGRHDICAIPRVVPVLKAMTALVLADFVLLCRRA